MIEQPELPAVVAAAHQLAPASGVAVIAAAVTRAVTIALAQAAGSLRCAAPPTVKIPPSTSLTCKANVQE